MKFSWFRCLEEVDTGGGGEEEKDLSWIQIFSTLFSEIKEKEFITPRDTLVESKIDCSFPE